VVVLNSFILLLVWTARECVCSCESFPFRPVCPLLQWRVIAVVVLSSIIFFVLMARGFVLS
jgi:hypothetical protein